MIVKFNFQEKKDSLVKVEVKEGKAICNGSTVMLTKEQEKFLLPRNYNGKVLEDGTVSVETYANLHAHTENSLLDGMSKMKDFIAATTIQSAITDHGNMYGMVEFYEGMRKKGKSPILAFEGYVVNPINGGMEGMHTVFLAENNVGLKNLMKLCSEAYNYTRYGKPHVTVEMMTKYNEGIIVSAACLGGPIQQAVIKGNREEAEYLVQFFMKTFPERFYLEIQRHNIPEELAVERAFVDFSQKYNVPIIATVDSHYTRENEALAHEILLCLQTGKTMNEPHMKFEGSHYWIHSSEEMEELFADHPEWLANTLALADRCNATLTLGEVNLPKFDIPAPFSSPEEYFEHLCVEGYRNRFGGTPKYDSQKYRDRFDYELKMIKQMGFCSYFLIVQDFINWARNHDIYVGPGRGSAAGSLLAYCIGITDLDPIEFNLIFERFLNPERVSWPDIDTDFEHDKRDEVIEYIRQKYGAESVCHIVTFGTMAAKMALKDVARALGLPTAFGANLAKMVPNELKMTIKKALDINPEFKAKYEEAQVKEVVDIAMALEGGKRHASVHACGLVIAPGEVSDYLPTSLVKDDFGNPEVTSQTTMTECEALSLLKMDLLGLKNMSVIHSVINDIKRTRGIDIRYQDIPLTDRATYEFLGKGHTGGVFQLESPGMTKVVLQMMESARTIPEENIMQLFENLIAAVALYRPGPMDYIPDYVNGSRHPDQVVYDVPAEEEILKSTFSVIVYQEQVIQLVQVLAGFSMGRADVVRKAMGKKKQDIMDAEKEVFLFGNKEAFDSGKDEKYVPGCIKNGIDEQVAREIWAKMESFGRYAFNRSHAACYAYIAYLTAYMSCHWPEEFYCGMLNAFSDNPDKLKSYLAQAVRRGIKILPPDVNLSSIKFSVENGGIRFGLKGLKDVGKVGEAIVEEREKNGPFLSFQDFYERSLAGKRATESLIFAGALNQFKSSKRTLVEAMPILDKDIKTQAKVMEGQCNLFEMAGMEQHLKIELPVFPEYDPRFLMEKEREYVGFYLTDHPLDHISIRDRSYIQITDLIQSDKSRVMIKTAGIIKDLRQIFSKNSEEMFSFSLEDRFNSVRCIVFPKYAGAARGCLENDKIIQVTGDYRLDENWGNQIVVTAVLPETAIQQEPKRKITVTINNKEDQEEVLDIVKKNPGTTEVHLYANGKNYKLKQQIQLTPQVLMTLQDQFKVDVIG